MSRFVYRCNRCRTRNTFPRPVEDYVRPRTCRDCGHTRFYTDWERTLRVPCRCGGYHWGPHRKGSPLCEDNPNWQVNRARQQGLDEDEIALAGLGREHKAGDPIPF